MSPDQWYIDGCLESSEDDKKRFSEWTSHLPVRNENTPFHCGAHSIRSFEVAFSEYDCGIGDVLEIGFCLGHSASIMLELGASRVVSIDNSSRDETQRARWIMKGRWQDRFLFFDRKDSAQIKDMGFHFTMAFIDGDHSESAISRDLDFVLSLGIRTVLFDDFWPHWGDTQAVLMKRKSVPTAIIGTMALCHFPANK